METKEDNFSLLCTIIFVLPIYSNRPRVSACSY